MNTPDRESLTRLLEDLESLEKIYLKLIELTENQSQVIASGVTEELMRLADSKSLELDRLATVEARMKQSQARWESQRENFGEMDRGRVKQAVGRVEDVLRRLLKLEEEEGQALARRRDDTVREMRRMDNSRRLSAAYGEPRKAPISALDQRE